MQPKNMQTKIEKTIDGLDLQIKIQGILETVEKNLKKMLERGFLAIEIGLLREGSSIKVLSEVKSETIVFRSEREKNFILEETRRFLKNHSELVVCYPIILLVEGMDIYGMAHISQKLEIKETKPKKYFFSP